MTVLFVGAAVTNHPTIHDKDPELVITATEVSKGVEHREPAERPISEKNFKLFHAMQKVVPSLFLAPCKLYCNACAVF